MSKLLTSGLFAIVLAITVSRAEGICSESAYSMPFAQNQRIVAGEKTINYTINSLLVTNNLLWCINGRRADLSHEKITMKNNKLFYQNPATSDSINGNTLYAMDAIHFHCKNLTNLKLVPIESTMGNISSTIILLDVIESQCPVLTHPINGEVVEIADRVVNYSCDKGYRLNGSSSTLCTDPAPTCEPITCNKLSITNGTVEYSNRDNSLDHGVVAVGVVASFDCHEGHILNGSSNMTCQSENDSSIAGSWNEDVPICQPIVVQPSTSSVTIATTSSSRVPSSSSTTLNLTPTPTSTSSPVATEPRLGSPEGIGSLLAMFVAGLLLGVLVAGLVCMCYNTQRTSCRRVGSDIVIERGEMDTSLKLN